MDEQTLDSLLDGEVVGLHYRSSQQSTNGVGNETEYLRDCGFAGASINPGGIVVARLNGKK